jgi:hypothetical protein
MKQVSNSRSRGGKLQGEQKMRNHLRLTLSTLLLMLAAGICLAQDARTIAAEQDFQRFDGNQSGWLSGKELIACQCQSYDKTGDNEVTKAEFFAGRGVTLVANKPAGDDTPPTVDGNTFKVGDRVEADPLLIENWRKGRIVKITNTGGIIVYEIKFDVGEAMLVRADSNAMHSIAGGEIDETVAATSSPQLSLSAVQMYDDYHNNEVAAKRKYVGKVVKVTGEIWIMNYSEMVRSYVALTARGYESAVTCYVVDKEQLVSLNRGETVSMVGTVSGRYTGSASISLEPCRIIPANAAANDAKPTAAADQKRNQPPRNAGGVVGQWYYTALINADGTATGLTHRQSSLDLKADGTYENYFGGFGGIGTYRVNGNSLTLNPENKASTSYALTFGDDGKRTFGLSGKTLTIINNKGIGYKLER